MFPHQGGQGQLPTHWQPPTSQQPANGSYPPPPQMGTSLPPPPPQEPRPDMAQHQHPHPHPHPQHPQHPQQQYRLPGPHEWTRAPPPPDPYRGQQPPPPPPGYMGHAHGHQPPAPRQRTAIACRYCRRRKIRCSGFENTDDGRCSNCIRFNQDCIFTPVSAQTQAFVPAHTVWRGVGQPPPMYGAYGQPLPPNSHGEGYPPQQQQQQQYLPSPTGAPGPYQAHSFGPPPPGAPYDDAGRDALNVRKRPYADPHTPTLPPPHPVSVSSHRSRDGSAGSDYPHVDQMSLTHAASPAPSAGSYPPPTAPGQPYYAQQPPRRASPQSVYSNEPARTSSSPHTQAGPATPNTPYYAPPTPTAGALQQPFPPRTDGRTPPPPAAATAAPASRPGMRINDLVDNGGRSSTDSDMLNMLNRRPM
ncbi:hypothetical protein P154DRAFT_536810 [Amniculicola lignicola CBS 123094]|uniref:Zn(2)-C6 fungal-type domain-containing protein n=1 Tax=Amniculicola lignicola CBS 123094 TaxID=1392246 RepID=A0A6A5W7Q2_9PLEO|nr:hypothetical protein P154DRAFT_536810 [Amniculicola lignicola CBS 123094]